MSSASKALCIGVNTAVDVTVELIDGNGDGMAGQFHSGGMHRGRTTYSAGGKATNVAVALNRTASSDQLEAHLVGIVAGRSGTQFRDLLPVGIKLHKLETSESSYTRVCYILVHSDTVTSQNTHTVIGDYGAPIVNQSEVLSQMEQQIRTEWSEAKFICVAGSVYPGMTNTFYAQLLERLLLRYTNTTIVCDFWGESVTGLPGSRQDLNTVIWKINRKEFENTFHCTASQDNILRSVTSHGFFDWAMVTDGPHSAILVHPKESSVIVYSLPRVQEINASGSGDCVVAGMINGMRNGLSVTDSFRLGLAYGITNAMNMGCCEGLEADAIDAMLCQVGEIVNEPIALK